MKPLWSTLFNLGLASFLGVIAAVAAFASTGDLRDGSTLIAVPIGIVVWFAGDILRWRGRYPMRLFLMVPIFVALVCTVSIRFLQKANQRRIAWNSMIEAGASVGFQTLKVSGWVQYDEGVFMPEFLETWLGSAVFANTATIEMPVVAFAEDSPASRVIRKMNFERSPMFGLEIADSSRNTSKLDLEASGPAFVAIRYPQNSLSQASIEAMCKSPSSMELGPVELTPESVQLLIDNETRTGLHLIISSIDSASFRRLSSL